MASEPEGLTEAELTISVDFTEPEILLLRRRAKDAGMSPTAFIRRAALGADPLALEQTLLAAGSIGIEDDELRVSSGIGIEDDELRMPEAVDLAPLAAPGEQISTAQAKAMLSSLIAGAERERFS
jgi:hypothetical protein